MEKLIQFIIFEHKILQFLESCLHCYQNISIFIKQLIIFFSSNHTFIVSFFLLSKMNNIETKQKKINFYFSRAFPWKLWRFFYEDRF